MGDRIAAQELYRRVVELFPQAHTAEGGPRLSDPAERHWPEISGREPTPEDAETCRLTMLTALQVGDWARARLWRARAIGRFTLTGWVEGVASIMMGDAFRELARVNDDYAAGRTIDVIEPSTTATGIMAELELFTRGAGSGFDLGPGSPSHAVVRRFYHEKRGFLLLVERRYQASGGAYDAALTVAQGNARGELKVRLGRLLVDYLNPSFAGVNESLAQATDDLGEAALRVSRPDLADLARVNAEVMRRGGRNVVPYEIL